MLHKITCVSDHMISFSKEGNYFYLHGGLKSVLLNYLTVFVVILVNLQHSYFCSYVFVHPVCQFFTGQFLQLEVKSVVWVVHFLMTSLAVKDEQAKWAKSQTDISEAISFESSMDHIPYPLQTERF